MTTVIKRVGASEPFLEHKLRQSIERAALSVRAFEGEATLLSHRVTRAVERWTGDKLEVTSRDIRELAMRELHGLHAEAAYAYAIHDDTF